MPLHCLCCLNAWSEMKVNKVKMSLIIVVLIINFIATLRFPKSEILKSSPLELKKYNVKLYYNSNDFEIINNSLKFENKSNFTAEFPLKIENNKLKLKYRHGHGIQLNPLTNKKVFDVILDPKGGINLLE